jgi:hypothetical protein
MMADAGRLQGLSEAAARAGAGRGLPPVELWNPAYCGEIDMRIARDGTWFYAGTPIGRPALVKLFSTILRKDPERFVLVTPVERVGITVEDAPFLAVEMRREEGAQGQTLRFRTNLDDWTEAGPDHPLRFEPGPAGGVKPYVHVRGGLWALVTRALTFDLFDLAQTREDEESVGVVSDGAFFALPRDVADEARP